MRNRAVTVEKAVEAAEEAAEATGAAKAVESLSTKNTGRIRHATSARKKDIQHRIALRMTQRMMCRTISPARVPLGV